MIKNNYLKISSDEVFYSLQGEGVTMGFPSVFLRLQNCNLKCVWCDTWYTWKSKTSEYQHNAKEWTIEETAQKVKQAWKCKNKLIVKRLVVTGGEPLLQQNNLVKLLKDLPDWAIEIETNGTIMPKKEFTGRCQFNCSPKLENSGNPKEKRLCPEVLTVFAKLPKTWFKFVVKNASDLKEVEKIVEKIHLSSEKVLIMPEGRTVEEIETVGEKLAKAVASHHWRITRRMQLVWFGDKRRT